MNVRRGNSAIVISLAYDYRQFRLRQGLCRVSAELRSLSTPLHCTVPPELRKDGQTWVNICRVIQLSMRSA